MRTLLALLLSFCTAVSAEPFKLASADDLKAMPADVKHVICDPAITDNALKGLSVATQLEELDLTLCRSISTDGLYVLKSFKKLRRLSLDQCRQLSDGALLLVSEVESLEDLDLSQGIKFTDEGMQHLSRLKNLKSIKISQPASTTAKSLKTVLALPKLEALHLRLTGWADDAALAQIAETKPGLRRLSLRECGSFTNAGLHSVGKLKELTWLDLGGARKLDGTGLAHLAGLSKLEYLNLIQAGLFKDDALTKLGPCPALKHLVLEGLINITGEAFAEWQPPALEHLEFKLTDFTERTLGAISKLPALRRLDLWNPFVSPTPRDLLQLAQLRQLRTLSLWSNKVTDEVLQGIATLPELEAFDLTNAKEATDAGLMHLAKTAKLKRLEVLSCDGITDEGLAALRKALPGCAITRLQRG